MRRSSAERGYGAAWQKASTAFLAAHPTCTMCAAHGRAEQAVVVDHITPHRGDRRLFWDRGNWQPICAGHHNGAKQRAERLGRSVGCDLDGWPQRLP